MTIIDLSHPITPGMPVYPGTQGPVFEEAATIGQDHFAEQRLSLATHTGTHVDAPAHILPGGHTLDLLPAGLFVGSAVVVDVSGVAPGAAIPLPLLLDHAARLHGLDFVLLRTGWERHWGADAYFADYPVLSEDAARWLAARGFKGLGVDAVSFDPVASLRNHSILLAAPMVLVENLANLAILPDMPFTFSCLPLPLAGADGSPVRAVALLD
ncbi:MAG: cyclase family protein [Desulfovibrionaceae bacterium]